MPRYLAADESLHLPGWAWCEFEFPSPMAAAANHSKTSPCVGGVCEPAPLCSTLPYLLLPMYLYGCTFWKGGVWSADSAPLCSERTIVLPEPGFGHNLPEQRNIPTCTLPPTDTMSIHDAPRPHVDTVLCRFRYGAMVRIMGEAAPINSKHSL